MALIKKSKREKEWRRVRKSKSKLARYCFQMDVENPWINLGKSEQREPKSKDKQS